MAEPLVTILLPAYDCAAVLPEALGSLAAQTLRDFRCLVLDDGSSDDTLAVAQAFARRDPRFEAVALPHQGIPGTLNAGLARCAGPFVARMDADDVAAPGRLEAQVALLRATEAGTAPRREDVAAEERGATGRRPGPPGNGHGVVVATRIRSFRSDGSPPGPGMSRYVAWVNRLVTAEEHFRERYVEAPVAHSSILARREVLARGYRDLAWCEDYDLWLSLMQAGVRFVKVPEVLLSVRDDGDRISRNDHRYSQDALRACKLDHLRAPGGPLHGRGVALLWGAGRVGKRWLTDLPAAGVSVPAVVDLHPRKLGRRIHGARVIAPEGLPGEWAQLRDPFLLVAVGAPGARADIRQRLSRLGLTELHDYLVVA